MILRNVVKNLPRCPSAAESSVRNLLVGAEGHRTVLMRIGYKVTVILVAIASPSYYTTHDQSGIA
jgi:hypothetical protein